MSTPLPNPHFVFPARDLGDATPPPSDSVPRTAAPLPAFSFNPGSQHSAQPSMPTLPSNRPGGHRRRCSEFVGGERPVIPPAPTEPPQSNEEGLAPAPAKLPAPGPGFGAGSQGKRRHAHRRSAAISSVDLTAISTALDLKPAIESAPLIQGEMHDYHASEEPPRPASQSAAILNRQSPPVSPTIVIEIDDSQHTGPGTPSNILASERSSTEVSSKDFGSTPATQPDVSSARNSGLASFSPAAESPSKSDKSRPRPRTADASFMLGYGADGLSPTKRPLSAAGHSRNRKSLSSGILEHFASSSRRSSSSSSNSDGSSDTSVSEPNDAPDAPTECKKKSKSKKKQKKVRSWAGAILTRGKGKRHSKKDRSETKSGIPPPVLTRTNSDLGSGLDVDFDDDNIVVIRTPTNPTMPGSRRFSADGDEQPSLENSWKPRSFYEQNTHDDTLSPLIDLDAALGPFNTPDMRSGNNSETGFSAATKRMYSGGRRGEFIGPEMRYHRRAESAPEMPPFDRSALGNNRFATSSTLENPDVLYEEEEDEFLAASGESQHSSEDLEPPAAVPSENDADSLSESSKDSSDTLTHQPVASETGEGDLPHAGLGIQKDEPHDTPEFAAPDMYHGERQSTEPQISFAQLQNVSNPFSIQSNSPADSAEPEWQHGMPAPSSPDISPRFMPADHRPVTASFDLTPNIPPLSLHGHGSLPSSSFPSPDFTISSDVPRSITTSSTTDRNFSNPSYNPSMEHPQGSVEDVPSLTSSASTTNTLNRISGTFFTRPRMSTDRSASFSAAVRRRTSQANSSKRSSLASLSKLVVGPHAERSKLSYEEKPPEDEPEKSKKKGRRISRLMHFWRTKDKDKSHEHGIRDQRPS
ncbi:cell wall proline rich protein [Aspergillus ellipticus CBS 707.79]|uniref:Cell wall proline rich protein n=1 Tax=Aspergillus ellipticus CBS 707.79 TaxID=1448320 RepID=A0A319DQ15_9EURO|nr:cell wall proline rich protein [Aspergillus ellipticus CBS 707.79]